MTEGSYPSLPVIKEAIDFSINQPRVINNANCIKARYDNGIKNTRSDGTAVIETLIMENMGSMNWDKLPDAKKTDIACTILARDWKGASNYAYNGVVHNE